MSDKLFATVEQRRSGARLIKLAGVLDEHNRLNDLAGKIGAGTALINLSGVERINSTGARDWVNWLASLEAKGIRPVLIACSPAVVEQLNRIKNFAGNAVVKSFQVPYHCASCDLDKLQLVHMAELDELDGEAPSCTCDGCGAAMVVVDESETYFAFVSQLPKYKPGTASEPVIDVEPSLARGSLNGVSGVTQEHVKKISKPHLVSSSRQSRPSLSAFQMPDGKRKSEQEILHQTPAVRRAPGNAGYLVILISIITLLLGTAGVLLYLMIN